MGEANSTLWVSCSSPVSDTQVRIHSAQQDSPVSKTIFHTLLLVFCQTKSSQIKTYLVKLTPHCGSAVGHLSLICTLFSSFFGEASLSKSSWMKPTPLLVSYQSPISCTQFKISSAQRDSPVSKIVFTPLALFLVDQVLAILRSRLRTRLHR